MNAAPKFIKRRLETRNVPLTYSPDLDLYPSRGDNKNKDWKLDPKYQNKSTLSKELLSRGPLEPH